MKKILVLVLVIFSLGFMSCEKEDIIEPIIEVSKSNYDIEIYAIDKENEYVLLNGGLTYWADCNEYIGTITFENNTSQYKVLLPLNGVKELIIDLYVTIDVPSDIFIKIYKDNKMIDSKVKNFNLDYPYVLGTTFYGRY